MWSIHRALPWLFVLATMAGASDLSAQSHRVPLSYDIPDIVSVGQLDWRGGLKLSSRQRWFGGLSALDIDDDGQTLTALTDTGYWVRLALDHDSRGYLVAARQLAAAPLNDIDNRPFRRKRDRDSESLARLADGSMVVAFEQRHRLLLYPPAPHPFAGQPRLLHPPPGLHGAPQNGGIEALTRMASGELFALSEKIILNDGSTLGWIGNGRHWRPLLYRTAEGFHATGTTALPDGDVLILERRLSIIGGFAARLVRVPVAAIRAATTKPWRPLVGTEIARLEAPLNVDNFEAVTAHRTAAGETLIYLLSDDNFFVLQSNLLFAFALRN